MPGHLIDATNPRRRFLAHSAAAFTALFAGGRPAWAMICRAPQRKPHPDPRPGITAERVLTHEQVGDYPDAIPAFDLVREIPQIVDGIRCNCGCADLPGFYSLLSCYEGDGMARHCDVCRGQGRLAHRLHAAGKTLDEIRSAIDARYG